MANLKNDLDEYMLMNEERKAPGYKLNMKMPKLPSVFGGNSESTSSNNSWLNDDDNGWCPKLNRLQRMIGCVICFGLGIFCLVVSTFYIPVLMFKARKFALLYSMASALFIAGVSFMIGFKTLLQSMFTKQKLAASICYSLSLLLTLYFAMWAKSTAFTVCFAIIQIISLGFMLFGVVPKGSASGFKFFGSLFKSQVSSTLPI
ncbi:CLUMA_CG013801, isoform A [Clunio marinus]|uniref:Vesicle transport protein n=1 Tax=Clunio marinus TaxID=568069 RepID=A0A1J1ILU6_9DIPT|nr:CLUMA_CG013801, isoform A [Clunio marinus]